MIKKPIDIHAYNMDEYSAFSPKSTHEHNPPNGFGSNIRDRFEYKHMKIKEPLPPPNSYKIKGQFGNLENI